MTKRSHREPGVGEAAARGHRLLLFDDVVSRGIHSRSVIRSAMDGIEYAPFEDRLETGRMLVDLVTAAAASGGTRLRVPTRWIRELSLPPPSLSCLGEL